MKKFLNKMLLLMGTTIFFTFAITGCKKVTPEQLLSETLKNLQEVNSLAGDISLEMTMGIAQNDLDMSLGIAMDMELEAIKDPLACHMKTELDFGSLGGKNSLEIYAKENKAGTKLTTYTATNGEWFKSEAPAEDELTEDFTNLDYFHSDDLILEQKIKKANGKEAYSIKSTITGEDLKESGLLDLIGEEELGIDFSDVSTNVTIMIYKEDKLPAYISFELKNNNKNATNSNVDEQVFISSMKCEITYKDYNAIDTITIPNEALDARNDILDSSEGDITDAIGSAETSKPLPAEDYSKIQKDKDGNYVLSNFTEKKEFSVNPPKEFKLDTEISSPASLSFDYKKSHDIDSHRVSLNYTAQELSDFYTEQTNIDYIKEHVASLSESDIEFFNIKNSDTKEVKLKDKTFKYNLLTYSYDKNDDVRELECKAWFVTEDGFILTCTIHETIYGKYEFMTTEDNLTDLMKNITE